MDNRRYYLLWPLQQILPATYYKDEKGDRKRHFWKFLQHKVYIDLKYHNRLMVFFCCVNVQLGGGNAHGEETNRKAEREWKNWIEGDDEIQIGRRNHNEFMASKGWHLTETGSEAEPQPEGNIPVIRGCFPAWLVSFWVWRAHLHPATEIKYHQIISIASIKTFHPHLILYIICLFKRIRELS